MPIASITRLPPDRPVVKENELKSKITTWLGAKIHQNYTPSYVLAPIVRHHIQNELTTVGFMGREGTGKTVGAGHLVHHVHTAVDKFIRSKTEPEALKAPLRRGYVFRRGGMDDLLDIDNFIRDLPPMNRFLLFDDVSFMKGKFSSKDIEAMRMKLTTIRHVDETVSVKTFIIFNYHYTRGLDKYARDTKYLIFTSVGREEIDNVISLMGNSKYAKQKVRTFMAITGNMEDRSGATVKEPGPDGKRYSVHYRLNDPFRISMVYDGRSPRFMASPHIDQLAPPGTCGVCHSIKQGLDPDQLIDFLSGFFTTKDVSYVMKLLYVNRRGPSVLEPPVARLYEILTRLHSLGLASADAVAERWVERNPSCKYVGTEIKPFMVPAAFFTQFMDKFGKDIRRHSGGSDVGSDGKTGTGGPRGGQDGGQVDSQEGGQGGSQVRGRPDVQVNVQDDVRGQEHQAPILSGPGQDRN